MTYKLLDQFRKLFDGVKYRHRDSSLGDLVASYLYEDLYDLGKSQKYVEAVTSESRALNTRNKTVGKDSRRGDGTFGERVPNVVAVSIPDYTVTLGEVATIEIGTEVKILAKAMIKQIDRVCTDMINQAGEFRKHGGNPICVGVAGINWAPICTSYEGDRAYPTDGRKNKHPAQEAAIAEQRLVARVKQHFDELILLHFKATNAPPYPFEWVQRKTAETEYAASLVRISRAYEARF